MTTVNRQRAVVGIEEARAELANIATELETHPEIAYEIVRDETSAAIILHPSTFERLLDAAQDSLDVDDAETALATEPFHNFADYHARRMARLHKTAR